MNYLKFFHNKEKANRAGFASFNFADGGDSTDSIRSTRSECAYKRSVHSTFSLLVEQGRQLERSLVTMRMPSNNGMEAPSGFKWVFTRYRRVKNSDRILDAHEYGYESWAFLVRA